MIPPSRPDSDGIEYPMGRKLEDPFAFVAGVEWHAPAHRAVMASVKLGAWLSAALDDPKVCDAMKADIREWFSAGEPMEILCQALASLHHQRTQHPDTLDSAFAVRREGQFHEAASSQGAV